MKIIYVSDNDIEAFKKLDPLFMLARTSVCNRFILGGVEEQDGIRKPIALMICEQVQDRIIIQWLYVEQEYRRQGIGSSMFEYLVNLATDNGITRLESYFVDTYVRHKVTPMDDVYFKQLGLVKERPLLGEWLADVKTFLANSVFENMVDNRKLVPMNMLSKGKISGYIEQLLSNENTAYLYGYDWDYLDCDADISYLLIDDADRVYGALLSDCKVELIMPVVLLTTNTEDAKVMAHAALLAAEKKFNEDLNICIQLDRQDVYDMVGELLPADRTRNYVRYADINRFMDSSYEQVMRTAMEYDIWDEAISDEAVTDIEQFLKKGDKRSVTIGELMQRKVISSAVIKDEISGISELDARRIFEMIVTCRHVDCYGTFDYLPSKPELEWFDPELSCYLSKNDEIQAIILVNITKGGDIFPLLMYASNPENGKYLLALIRNICEKATKKYSQDTRVVLRCYDELSTKMSEQVFGAK